MDIDWNEEYIDKHELMVSRGFVEVDSISFYRDLFPVGSLQHRNGDGSGKGNIIVTQVRHGSKRRSPQWVVGDDLKGIEKAFGDSFGLIAPVSYFGKTHKKRNAHELFAMTIDLDYVTVGNLKNLLKQFMTGVQLIPTYVVSSGRGLHLYYFLAAPLPMYDDYEKIYSELKKDFIRRLWNDTSSQHGDNPDITGVTQGFRAVGSLSKLGEGYPVRAYKTSDKRYCLQEIKDSIPECEVDLNFNRIGNISLELARLIYPEWYRDRIIDKKPKLKRKPYTQNKRLYQWWKQKMLHDVRSGGRYYSIMALCSFGLKCGVSDREIRKDARTFFAYYESLTEDENNHFTEQDIEDALRNALRKENRERTLKTTRQWIVENTKVEIVPQIVRKGKKQADHLAEARAVRDVRQARKGTKWNGRKSKADVVADWRKEHPEGRKADCIRDTGLSKPTVYKHWEGGAVMSNKEKDFIFTDVMTIEEASAELDRLQAFLDTLSIEEKRLWYFKNQKNVDELIDLLEQFAQKTK